MSDQKKLNRRDFLKGAAISGAGLAAVGALGASSTTPLAAQVATPVPTPQYGRPGIDDVPAPVAPWLPAKWDYEADVVVVGYGGAGVCAAVAAYDAGAKVLVLEKAPKPDGGNTGCAGGTSRIVTPLADFITWMKMGCWGTVTDDELIATTCKAITDLPAWLESLGAKLMRTTNTAASNGWPVTLQKGLVSADFKNTTVALQKPDGSQGRGVDLFKFLHGIATSKEIPVMLSTPAKELIQDAVTKEILGVKAVSEGKDIYVKAKKGVVMALGGYENNPEMRANFLKECHSEAVTFWGTPYNTGDGIFMTNRVGAKLWHMSMGEALGSDFACKAATEAIGQGVQVKANANNECIFVNRYGKRFWNEHIYTGHSSRTMPFEEFLEEFKPTDPEDFCDYPNVPFYMIFDDTLMKKGCLSSRAYQFATSGYLGVHAGDNLGKGYWWSNDNQTELAKGWILKADTIEELGKRIVCKNYFGQVVGIDVAGLVKTVNDYNSYCTAGKDPQFGRAAESLVPINKPPFYAIELIEGHLNTNGGPVHNKYSQTTDADGKPIPRLYSAGEFGSIFGFLYYGQGNIPEALAMGKIAGGHAASLEPWGAA